MPTPPRFRRCLPWILFAAVGCARAPRSAGPNLLLVTLDTVRADHVGAYGATGAETPNLDRLAREGLRFDSVTAAAPLTLPAHATLLSGLLPVRHGVHLNGGRPFPAARATLATLLESAGYDTGAFVGAFVLDHRFGLAHGFATYDDDIPRGPGNAVLEAERPGSVVADRALAWLRRERQKPFFAWVHLYDAHSPYEPPEPFRTRHAADRYAGEIAAVDQQVGRLLEALRSAGALDRTLVVVVADHGEALGEHGELTHGLLLYEPTLRVPLLMRAPGVLSAGQRVARPVGAADLAPTILGLLGTAGTHTHDGDFDGRDLAAAIRSGQEPAPADLYAETEYPTLFGWGALSALRRGDRKLIAGPRPELYDLAHDGAEAHDLLAGDPHAAAALETTLSQLRKQSQTTVANLPQAVPDAETRARLLSLGYASGATVREDRANRPSPRDMAPLLGRFEQARSRLRAGEAAAAATALGRLVQEDGDNPVFVGAWAQSLLATGQREAAIQAYLRATELSPNDSRVWYDLGVALREAGRLDQALQALREALRRDPLDAEAQNGLGIAESLRGNTAAAQEAFARAVELDPRDAAAQNNLGNALRGDGRLDEAAAAYRLAIAAAPDYADALNGLGVLEVARNRAADGIPLLQRALSLAPGNHEIRLNLGVAYELLGDRDQAIAAYRDFLNAAVNDPQFAPQRAAVRQRLKNLGVTAGGP